jgi:hypothetical protein
MNMSMSEITPDRPVSQRRPSREEAMMLILQLADRMERQATRVANAAVMDDHQKAGLAGYLKTEASNLRKLMAGDARVDGSLDGSES